MRRIYYGTVLILLLLLALALSLPIAAQTTITWNASYYPAANFSGSVVTTTHAFASGSFSLNLDSGLPSGIPSDSFSARFTADITFPAGTTCFAVRANQRTQLYVGSQLVVDTNTSPGNTVTNGIVLAAGTQTVRMDYTEDSGDAFLFMNWGTTGCTASGGVTATPGGTVTPGAPVTGVWTAQYYPNFTLSGTPVTATVSSPSFDYGGSAPAAGIPVDNWSARFTSIQSFTAGVYRFEIRADDGVRLTVAGLRAIDHWYPSNGSTTYVANVYVSGASSVTVEYYEGVGGAVLSYNVSRAADGTATTVSYGTGDPTAVGGAVAIGSTARIQAGTLNVRSLPGLQGQVVAKVHFGENYVVIGANADRSWYQLRVGLVEGWVSAKFIRVSAPGNVGVTSPTNEQSQVANPIVVPITVPGPSIVQPAATGYALTATANLIIRSSPTTRSSRNGIVPAGAAAEILGRNSTNTWWYITQNLQVGWVNASYVILPGGIDINRVPVVAQ